MMRSLYTAASGMNAQQTHIDVVAHNVANVGTAGFRRARAEFQDLLYTQVREPGARTASGGVVPTGVQVGQGVRTVATDLILTQGALQQTGAPLDMAIEGNGFFQIRRGDGETAFTRAGTFQADPEGRLVTADGLTVEPAIALPQGATNITIAADGTIQAVVPGQAAAQEVGRIELASFSNAAGLEALGRNQYRATAASGPAIVGRPGENGIGTIAQGFIEGSNVEVVTEMIDLITSQRAYEINQRVIQASDEMLRKTTEV